MTRHDARPITARPAAMRSQGCRRFAALASPAAARRWCVLEAEHSRVRSATQEVLGRAPSAQSRRIAPIPQGVDGGASDHAPTVAVDTRAKTPSRGDAYDAATPGSALK